MARLSPLIGKGPPKGNRVVRLPLRIAVIVLAAVAMGLSIWGIWLHDNNFGVDLSALPVGVPDTTIDPDFFGDYGYGGFAKRQFGTFNVPTELPPGKEPLGLMIYVSIQIFIVVGGAIAVEYLAPRFFYRAAVITGYVLTIILSLAAWAFMASSAADYGDWNKLVDQLIDSSQFFLGTDLDIDNPVIEIYAAQAAAAGAMALAWLLMIIETILFVRACMTEPKVEEGQGQAATNVQDLPPHKQEENIAGFYAPPQPTQSPPQGYYPPPQHPVPSPVSQQPV